MVSDLVSTNPFRERAEIVGEILLPCVPVFERAFIGSPGAFVPDTRVLDNGWEHPEKHRRERQILLTMVSNSAKDRRPRSNCRGSSR